MARGGSNARAGGEEIAEAAVPPTPSTPNASLTGSALVNVLA